MDSELHDAERHQGEHSWACFDFDFSVLARPAGWTCFGFNINVLCGVLSLEKHCRTASECRTIGADESLRPCSSFGPLSFPREGEMWGPGQRVPGPTLITADHALSPLLTRPR
jgi:hypothetical protein